MRFESVRQAALLLCAFFIAACSGIPSNEGRLVDPTVKAKTATAAATPPKSGPVDVYLIPMDDFPEGALPLIGDRLTKETGLNVRAASPVDATGLQPYQLQQYATDELIALLGSKTTTLSDTNDKTIFIAYTKRDINDRNGKTRFLFAQANGDLRISVISASRMSGSARWDVPPVFLADRIHKMSKRAIGDLYFKYPRTTNPKDLMYAPIMSADDIDRIGNEFPSSALKPTSM